MSTVFIRRFLTMFFIIVGVSVITFSLSRLIPADPARLLAGPRAGPEGVARVRQEYGLDRSPWEQYVRYMTNVLQLDFGQSFSTRRPVVQDLKEFVPATFELVFFAVSFAVIGGVSLGVLSAVHRNDWMDGIMRLLATIGLSSPAFWLALLAQIWLYRYLGLFPFGSRLGDQVVAPPQLTGLLTVDSLLAWQPAAFVDAVHHLILPAFVLGLEPLAVLMRITRTSMLEVMHETFTLTARAKGLWERTVIGRHVLRNALPPIITTIGLQVGYLMGGAILVESVFAWPGIGRYSANAIASGDYNAIMAVTFFVAVIYLSTSLVVDVWCVWLDPRMREQ